MIPEDTYQDNDKMPSSGLTNEEISKTPHPRDPVVFLCETFRLRAISVKCGKEEPVATNSI